MVMGNEDFLSDTFDTLKKKMDGVTQWQSQQYELYSGKWTPKALNISVSPELDGKLSVHLDWAKVGVDFLSNQLNFDILENDDTDTVYKNFAYGSAKSVISSAIKNSMIGACSFVSITPGRVELGEPPVVYTAYAGYEATGNFNTRTGKLDSGLVIESWDGTSVATYLLFLPDGTYRVDAQTKIITKICDSNFGCQLVPFVYDQDVASRPFGSARITSSQKGIMGSAIRTLKRSELAAEFYSTPLRYIFTKGGSDENRLNAWNSSVGALLELNTEDNVDSPTMGQLIASDPEPFIKQFRMFAEQFAAQASMNSQEFGVSPANGSMSADAEAERARKMQNLIAVCQDCYGRSIKEMGLHTLAVVNGSVTPDDFALRATWVRTVLDGDIGKIGDALGKIFESVPELAKTDIAFELLGVSKESRKESGSDFEALSPKLQSISDELRSVIQQNAQSPENSTEDNIAQYNQVI